MRSPREIRATADGGSGPRRTCIGCRQVRPKAELVRLVRRPDGTVVPDATGDGRGAYVCPDPACLARAMRPGRLAHAFKKSSVPGSQLTGPGPVRTVRTESSP